MTGLLLGALAALLFVAPPASGATTGSGDVGVQAVHVGQSVCIQSRVGGYRCGTVTALNQTVCYPQGCLYGLARTNIIPQPGDYGAPVYSGRLIVGTVVGGAGNSTFFDPS